MLWTAFSRPFEFKREFSRKLLAQGMARERWRGNTIWSNIRSSYWIEVSFSRLICSDLTVRCLLMEWINGVQCAELIKIIV